MPPSVKSLIIMKILSLWKNEDVIIFVPGITDFKAFKNVFEIILILAANLIIVNFMDFTDR